MNELLLIFATVTQTFNLSPGLLSSICYVESTHKVRAIHVNDGGSDSLGLCQIKLTTAKSFGYKGTAKELHNSPFINAYYAGKYIRHQLNRYNGDVIKAIAAYNAGIYRISNDGRSPKNKLYVAKVLKAWSEHR